jgi:hypothetical protein
LFRSWNRLWVALTAILLPFLPNGLTAQTVDPGAAARAEATAHALEGGVGLLLAGGGSFPVSPSTAGHRLFGSPRLRVDVGTTGVTFRHPDLSRPAVGGGFDPSRRRVLGATRLSVGAGILEGFSPVPTIGGIGSLDLVGELRHIAYLGGGEGPDTAFGWGVGGHLGLLRESFTMPGVTVALTHRRAGTTRYVPGGAEGAGTQVAIEPRVTSLRGVVGKDLLFLGLSGGVQRDRMHGGQEILLGGVPIQLPASTHQTRTTWFGGVNLTWVVAQLAAEVGWSPDDEGNALLGSVSFRITY